MDPFMKKFLIVLVTIIFIMVLIVFWIKANQPESKYPYSPYSPYSQSDQIKAQSIGIG